MLQGLRPYCSNDRQLHPAALSVPSYPPPATTCAPTVFPVTVCFSQHFLQCLHRLTQPLVLGDGWSSPLQLVCAVLRDLHQLLWQQQLPTVIYNFNCSCGSTYLYLAGHRLQGRLEGRPGPRGFELCPRTGPLKPRGPISSM